MGLIDTLARHSGLQLRKVGSLQLVAFPDVQYFLDACMAAGILVIGIEGFSTEDGEVRPDMSAIADFSELTRSSQSIVEARMFVDSVGRPEMLFDFTLSKGEDYGVALSASRPKG
ncbi:MAG: hypothetical protein GY854_04140 [Deltaproteobacteria bacterium]|nr:hypothetical protein [Deltaproteobacteria bacterium]